MLNVTAVGYLAHGWLTLYPSGEAVPSTSTLNFDRTEYAMANAAIVKVGSNGKVCVSLGTVNGVPGNSKVLLDATGYLSSSGLALVQLNATRWTTRAVTTKGWPS